MSETTIEILEADGAVLARWHQTTPDGWLGYPTEALVRWYTSGDLGALHVYVHPGERRTTAGVIRYVAGVAAAGTDPDRYREAIGNGHKVALTRTMRTDDMAALFAVDAARVRDVLADLLVFA